MEGAHATRPGGHRVHEEVTRTVQDDGGCTELLGQRAGVEGVPARGGAAVQPDRVPDHRLARGRPAPELDDLAVARVVEAGERRGVRARRRGPGDGGCDQQDGEPHGLTLHERPLQRSSFTSFAASFALIFA